MNSIARGNDVSVVVPLLNEEGSLGELHRRVRAVLAALNLRTQFVFVDDGSTDRSFAVLKEIQRLDPNVEIIRFRRNLGKAAALRAGFGRITGEWVFTMDADLQDEPEEMPKLLAKLHEGYDVVSGWKRARRDPVSRVAVSRIFNFVVSRLSGVQLHDFNSGFKIYRREAIRNLPLQGELHRFIPVLVAGRGYRVGEVAVRHEARRYGRSKYGLDRIWKGAFDLMTVVLMTRFQARPLHLFGGVGALVGTVGFGVLLYLTGLWAFNGEGIGKRPLLLFGALCILFGVQLVSTGLLAELICRERLKGELDDMIVPDESSGPAPRFGSTENHASAVGRAPEIGNA